MKSLIHNGLRRVAWMVLGGVLTAELLVGAPALTQTPEPTPAPSYMPSVGDLMTTAVQPRHIKLGLAGHARDWDYAAYEVGELRNAFNRVVKLSPIYEKTTDMAQMVAANIKDPIDQMTAAIKAKNGKAFDTAYTAATNACNACHLGLKRDYVVIKQPIASPYPNQSFAAPRRAKAN